MSTAISAEALEAPAEAASNSSITIVIPEGLREVTLDRATLELWLDVLEAEYTGTPRGDMAAALLESLKATLKLAHFYLRRKPFAGWEAPPARDRRADILPFMGRYLARGAFDSLARRHRRVDLAAIVQARAAIEEVARYALAEYQHAGATLDALPTGSATASAAIQDRGGATPGTSSEPGSADASGSGSGGRGRGAAIGIRRRRR